MNLMFSFIALVGVTAALICLIMYTFQDRD